ncbi:MAG: hypothetical protein LUD40_13510 [Phocaeicola dorei]|nr:hypothetical protein [Phocaeicola dorei]
MMKKINIQNDMESRRRIAEALPEQESEKNELADAQSEEVPEHPAVETHTEPETPKKGRRKAPRNA